MRKILYLALAAGLLSEATVRAQETPRGLLQRAIKAHGGEDKLAKLRADKVKLKGVLVIESREVPFTAETTMQLPGQFKTVKQITVATRSITLVHILNGDQAYLTIDGQPQKVEAGALAEMKETMQLDRAVRLVPLLSDRSFELEILPEVKVNDRRATGIRVRAKGRKELRMYFDRETALLLKTEHKLDDKAGKEVRQEEYYSDFRDLGGYRRPVKVSAFRAGKKVMEAELTEVKYYDHIDDAEFAKP